MARPSLIDEWKPHLLCMERYCQRYGLTPNAAAVRIANEPGRKLPGDSNWWSKVRMLKKHHGLLRDELRLMLAQGTDKWPESALAKIEGQPYPGPKTYAVNIGIKSPTRLSFMKRHFVWLADLGAILRSPKVPKD
jgi:hypothetical protein